MMTGRLHGRSRLGMPPAKKATPVTKKSAAPAKTAVQATITLKHPAAELAEGHDLAKSDHARHPGGGCRSWAVVSRSPRVGLLSSICRARLAIW